jgi:hypothetical protein
MRKNNAALTTTLRQKIFLITSGIFFFLILLEISLRLGGFILLSLQEYRNRLYDRQQNAYRIMCLGESTTAMGGENSYPSQLEKILNQHNIGIKFSVINRGVSAVATSYILAHLEENVNRYNPRMVITMMGIGDGRPIIYRDKSSKKILPLFGSLRLCKLATLIWLHIVVKAKEIGLYQFQENKSGSALSPGIFIKERQGPSTKGDFTNMGMISLGEASGEDGTTGVFCKNINVSKAGLIKRHNYQEVKRILDRRGIKLVCAQYPMLKVGELKQIFEGQKGVVFVDNEGIFKEAVKKSGYQKYFIDRFGGEFGHCTREGNRLLAENIVNVILKECFNK